MKIIKTILSFIGWPPQATIKPLTLPRLGTLDLDRSIYSASLMNDFLNVPVDRDLTAWRKYDIEYISDDSSLPADKTVEYTVSDAFGDSRQNNDSSNNIITLRCAMDQEQAPKEEMVNVPTDQEKAIMIESALKAVSELSPTGCLRHREGWWTYEVCHKKRIRQFHVITATDLADFAKSGKPGKSGKQPKVGAISSEYLLGRFLPNQPSSTDIKFGNVFTMTYNDGDSCRTADRGIVNRVTEVRFVCASGGSNSSSSNNGSRLTPHFIDVFERQVCNYVIIIGVPSLCAIPHFTPWTRPKQTIKCVSSKLPDRLDDPLDSSSSSSSPSSSSASKEDDKKEKTQERERSVGLEKLKELVDSTSDTFPLLRQAIMDLLQTEYGQAMPDSLNSHLPRRSLFDVFAELAEAQSSTSEEGNTGRVGKREEKVPDSDDEADGNNHQKENPFLFRVDL